jgi:hypothetical protein
VSEMHGNTSAHADSDSFVITRKLVNWDTDYILGQIHGLLQSCGYKPPSHIEITFPVQHHQTIIKGEQSFGSVLRSAFIGSEKYEVEVCWPYATHSAEDSDGESRSQRQFLVRSEIGWFRDWKPVLKAAILGRKRGWVGADDYMEVMMRPPTE